MKRYIKAASSNIHLSDIRSDLEALLKGRKYYNLDYDNDILEIPCSAGITEDEMLEDGMLGDWFKQKGFNVSFRKDDFEYTTKPTWINYRGSVQSKGHTAYLRNRLIMTITGG